MTSGSTSSSRSASGVRERRLHLCRCTPEHAKRFRPRHDEPVTPKRRLADAGFTFEHARGRTLLQGFEEAAETFLLGVSTEKNAGH
jgi:hypothetical protein